MYDALLNAYRDGATHAAAAAAANVVWRTAKRAFEIGWPRLRFRPIRDVLAEEAALTRAFRQEAEANARLAEAEGRAAKVMNDAAQAAAQRLAEAQARAEQVMAERVAIAEAQARRRIAELNERANVDVVEQRAEEAILVRSARKNAVSAQVFISLAWQNARALAETITQAVQAGGLSPQQALAFGNALMRGTREVNQAAMLALELERLRTGEPAGAVEIQADPATLEEAASEVERAQALIDLARRSGADDGDGTVH